MSTNGAGNGAVFTKAESRRQECQRLPGGSFPNGSCVSNHREHGAFIAKVSVVSVVKNTRPGREESNSRRLKFPKGQQKTQDVSHQGAPGTSAFCLLPSAFRSCP